jgi:hypothetical protein
MFTVWIRLPGADVNDPESDHFVLSGLKASQAESLKGNLERLIPGSVVWAEEE